MKGIVEFKNSKMPIESEIEDIIGLGNFPYEELGLKKDHIYLINGSKSKHYKKESIKSITITEI